jgi:hypothetical protein
MDVGLPEESVDQSQRKKTHSPALLSSAVWSASNVKKNLTSLMKKKKWTNNKKKSERKSYRKQMSLEDDGVTTDAVASQASYEISLVNKLGMAAEPTYYRSRSERPLSHTEQQPQRNRRVSCPGALEVLLGGGDQTSLNSEYMSRETKNTVNATMDSRETGSNQHLTDLQPTAEEAAPPPQETPPYTITPPTDDSGQSYCLDACWPTSI